MLPFSTQFFFWTESMFAMNATTMIAFDFKSKVPDFELNSRQIFSFIVGYKYFIGTKKALGHEGKLLEKT